VSRGSPSIQGAPWVALLHAIIAATLSCCLPAHTTSQVHNPVYDYIPPHLVSLFVTDTGGYTPAYVYKWVFFGGKLCSCRC
jgi:translation initiation factor 2B subunit (eIF-2B alpha/beta/delta family)